jgi:transposase-like protein
LFTAGRSQAEVAHQLGVSRQNVSRWHPRWRSGGSEALRSRLMTWIGVSIETAQHLRSDHDPERDLEHD